MLPRRKRIILITAITILCALSVFCTELILRKISGRRYYRSLNEPYVMAGRTFAPEANGYLKTESSVFAFDYSRKVFKVSERFGSMFPLRDNEAHDLKVTVIGASVADGVGASSPETAWYSLLEKDLTSSLGKKVILERLTMPGIVSTQERVIQELIASDRHPDAIIILDGFADLGTFLYNARPGDPYDQALTYERENSILFNLGLWLSERSEIVNTFWRFYYNNQISKARESALTRSRSAYISSVSSVYLDNIHHMLEWCSFRKIPCAVFLQPAKALLRQENINDHVLSESYQVVRSEFAQKKFPYVDLAGIFSEQQIGLYRDTAHFNDKGQMILAMAMKEHVLRLLK